MKKTYEPETKRAIEQVIDVFNDYIRTSTHFELLWSDKVGYIYISIDNVQGSIGDTGCCVVNCGEELFDKLVWESAVDIMEEVGHTIDPTEATLLERREIERRIHPYLEQLPTYQDRLQRVFKGRNNDKTNYSTDACGIDIIHVCSTVFARKIWVHADRMG